MDTITITVAENDPDVIVSATLNEDAVTITLNEAAVGASGAAGVGVPTGGAANDILKKTSATNYATAWETPTSAATANTVVRRDASGGAAFDDLTAATMLFTGSIQSTAANAFIATTGNGASIRTEGVAAFIGTYGVSANIATAGTDSAIATLGANSEIYTDGANSPIYTRTSNSPIYTTASDSNIETQHESASVRSYNFAALDATAGASLKNSAGTAVLTWGATAGNISITVDTTSTGHFFSNPGTATAGHFITKNGTTPTLVAGRSAWFSDSSGSPQFKNGTGGAVTLIYNGSALGTPASGTLTSCTGLPISTGVSGLGTGVATLLTGTPSGTGGPVGTTSPTISNPTASTASSSSAALLVSGPTSGVDTLRIQGTTTASYSSIGFIDNGNVQRGSFGYSGTTAGSFANTTFLNAANGVPLTLGTNSAEKIRIATSGGVSIGTTTDAGAGNLLLAGTITTVGPASSTARPMKFGSVTSITDASMVALGFTSQQKVEINAVAYWIPMKTSAWT